MRGFFPDSNTNQKIQPLQRGQALLEYALLIAIASMLSLGFMATFSGILNSGITRFNAVLESELRTCSFDNPTPIELWDN